MWMILILPVIFELGAGSEIDLKVSSESENGSPPSFSFKCSVHDFEDSHVSSIKLFRQVSQARGNVRSANRQLIAYISFQSPDKPIAASGFQEVKLEGHIDIESDSDAYLEVTFSDLRVEDLGLYTCEAALVDEDRHITFPTAEALVAARSDPARGRLQIILPTIPVPRTLVRSTAGARTTLAPRQLAEVTLSATEDVTVSATDAASVPEETTAAVEETTAAVEETTAAVEETTAAVEVATAAVEETTAAVDETTTAVEETTSAVEETTAAVEETTAAVEETTAAVEETTAAVEETTAAVEETTAAVEETTAAVEETTAAAEEATAAVEETTAAVEETTAAVKETTAAVEETTAALEETTAAVKETTAAVEETTAAVEETTAAVEETTVAVEETTAAVEEPTAAVEEATAAVEETTAAVEEKTIAVEETTAAPEKTTEPHVDSLIRSLDTLVERLGEFNDTVTELEKRFASLQDVEETTSDQTTSNQTTSDPTTSDPTTSDPEPRVDSLVRSLDTLVDRLEKFNDTVTELEKKYAALQSKDVEDTTSDQTPSDQTTSDQTPSDHTPSYQTTSVPVTSTSVPAVDVANHFVYENTSYFFFKPSHATDIATAKAICESRRFYLTEVNDAGELQAIADEVSPHIIEEGAVLIAGEKEIDQDIWFFPGSQKQVDYFAWGPGEPAVASETECLALRKHGDQLNMVAVPCTSAQNNFYFLCEHDD